MGRRLMLYAWQTQPSRRGELAMMAGIFAYLLGLFIAPWFMAAVASRVLPETWAGSLTSLLTWLVGLAFWIVVGFALKRVGDRRYLRRLIASRDRCDACGYSVKALNVIDRVVTCPECGQTSSHHPVFLFLSKHPTLRGKQQSRQ